MLRRYPLRGRKGICYVALFSSRTAQKARQPTASLEIPRRRHRYEAAALSSVTMSHYTACEVASSTITYNASTERRIYPALKLAHIFTLASLFALETLRMSLLW